MGVLEELEGQGVLGEIDDRAPMTPKQRLAAKAVGWLPTVGATVGGLVGGTGGTVFGLGVGGVPGALGGAALGGAGGEAAKQIIGQALGLEGAPQSSLEAAQGIGRQAVEQAAYEAAGAGLGAGLAKVGSGVMQGALRAGKAVAEKFPGGLKGVAETAIRERVPVGKLLVGKPGSEIASAKRAAEAGIRNQELKKIGKAGLRLDPTEIMKPVFEQAKELRKIPAPAARRQAAQLEYRANRFIRENLNGIPPLKAKRFKKFAQESSLSAQKAKQQFGFVPRSLATDAAFHEAAARGARAELEGIDRSMLAQVGVKSPGIGAREARIQNLIGLQRTARKAEGAHLPLLARHGAPVVGAGIAAAFPGSTEQRAERAGATLLATHALMNPAVASRLALILSDPSVIKIGGQSPRWLGQYLGERITEE